MYCSNCGTQFEGKFCPQCGTTAPGTAPPPAGPTAQSEGMADNVAGTLAYLLGFITGILFLVIAPYNKNRNVRFHAFQSIFVSAGLMILQIAVNAVLPWAVSLALSPLIGLAGLVLWIYLLVKTYQGQKVVLPIVGPLAEKQA